jgi:AhpD family alkylhydroperoxidase
MDKNYPAYRTHLQGLLGQLRARLPGPMRGFGQLHGESMKAGALSGKHKELIALALGVAARCDGCIAFHTHEALAQGATRGEVEEALAVAISMGGGPALMYAAHAVEALEQFGAAG